MRERRRNESSPGPIRGPVAGAHSDDEADAAATAVVPPSTHSAELVVRVILKAFGWLMLINLVCVVLIFLLPKVVPPPGHPIDACGEDFLVVAGTRIEASGVDILDPAAFKRSCEDKKERRAGVTLLLNAAGDQVDPETGRILAGRGRKRPTDLRYDAFRAVIDGRSFEFIAWTHDRVAPIAWTPSWISDLLYEDIVAWRPRSPELDAVEAR